jgi:eukaryotic-like serine/threonine-protein kinase
VSTSGRLWSDAAGTARSVQDLPRAADVSCSRCGTPRTPSELCSVCILRAALEPHASRIGDYEIIEQIGHGGMGVVYRARHRISGQLVALKMIRRDLLPDNEALRLFRREIEATVAVEHPHIVPLFYVGEHDGELYYAMKLLDSSLAERLSDFRQHPWAAAKLMENISRAVQHAHARGFLHLDLKPSNVLLDAAGHPYVGDFGLAKLVNGSPIPDWPFDRPDALKSRRAETFRSQLPLYPFGTPQYLAPEQALHQESGGTVASDVYSLGVIFYELLTGSPPFAGPLSELVVRMAAESPKPPSKIARGLSPDLEALCLKCLRKDPEGRYRSPGELADDLARALRGKATLARPLSVWGRSALLLRRNPALSFCAATVAALLIAVCVQLVGVAVHHDRETRARVLEGNGFAAKMAAMAVLDELRRRADWALEIAADPIAYALATREPRPSVPELDQFREGRFGFIAILSSAGTMTAMSPAYKEVIGRDYAWRDYFRGACKSGARIMPGAYVARSHRAETDNEYKFAISAPIVRNGTCVGVVLAATQPDSTLGPFVLINRGDPRHKAVVMGYPDRDRIYSQSSPLHSSLVLLHDGLGSSEEIPVSQDTSRAIQRSFGAPRGRGQQLFPSDVAPLLLEDYRPMADTRQRWVAAFYPVGGTGLVVGVQTRYDLAFALSEILRGGLLSIAGIQAVGCALIAVTLITIRRNRGHAWLRAGTTHGRHMPFPVRVEVLADEAESQRRSAYRRSRSTR